MNLTILVLTLFLIPVLAGLLLIKFKSIVSSNIKLYLAFSAAFLLAICLIHLLPEVFHSSENLGVFVLIGFFIQIILEYFSSGIEHGHIHHSKSSSFPYLIFGSLFIHSFMEGFPLAELSLSKYGEEKLIALLTGVILHKIPIAIVLTTLLLDKKIKLNKIITALVLFGISAPLGMLVVYYTSFSALPILIQYLTAITVGIFLHISTVILFESSDNHHFNRNKFISILLGVALALLVFGTH